MVWMNGGRRVLKGSVGKVAAEGAILAAIGGAVALAAMEGTSLSGFALHAAVAAGVGAVWLQTRAVRRVADKATADLDVVAKCLIQLEYRLIQAAGGSPDPVLRSTVAEVTGEIGLLGGIIRDLAETVAAQDRDVADLKERIQPATP